MATNRAGSLGRYLTLDLGADFSSGDPVVMGQLYGVVLEDTVSHVATIDTEGVYNLPVTGEVEDASASAIAAGDIVYFDAEEGHLNADDTDGVRFGYALDAVGSGDTTTIRVRLGY